MERLKRWWDKSGKGVAIVLAIFAVAGIITYAFPATYRYEELEERYEYDMEEYEEKLRIMSEEYDVLLEDYRNMEKELEAYRERDAG